MQETIHSFGEISLDPTTLYSQYLIAWPTVRSVIITEENLNDTIIIVIQQRTINLLYSIVHALSI